MALLYLLTTNFEQRTNLQELLNNMENIRIQEFSNMHAVTATLEAIATYLVPESHSRLFQRHQLISRLDFHDKFRCVCNPPVLGLLLPAHTHEKCSYQRLFGLDR